METRAVIVGASVYRQKEIFAPLRGAARDAIWFERFLRDKGIPQNNIFCLTGEAATKGAILDSIVGPASALTAAPINLLISFSGHGGTLRLAPGVSECVLFCHDTSIEDRLGTSISIAELIQAIAKVRNAQAIYLFLDACNLTLEALAQQIQPLAARSRKVRVFCCLLANDGGISLEGFTTPMGEFSSVLLASMLTVDSATLPSVGGLVLEVARRSERSGVSAPTSILLGDVARWPFSPQPQLAQSVPLVAEVPRPQLVEEALGILRDRTLARICISGASGTGKSIVLNQIAARLGRCPVARFVRDDAALPLNLAVQRLVEAIAAKVPAEEVQRPVALTLESALLAFSGGNPHAVIAIDGGENLSNDVWFVILRAFELHAIDLLTTRHDRAIPGADALAIDIEPMTTKELKALPGVAFRSLSRDAFARAEAASGGFPLAFLRELDNSSSVAVPDSLRRVEQSLRLSRGYCDEALYCAMTGIARRDLERLSTLGLLVQEQQLIRLHDAADQYLESEDAALMAAVSSYWQAELGGPYAVTAALRIVELATDRRIQFAPGTIAAAIKRAEARVTSSALTNVALCATRCGDELAMVEAVDILSRRGNSHLLASLLEATDTERVDENRGAHDPRIDLAKARAAWWGGDYAACRRHAGRVLSQDASHRGALLEVAIADFFEGRWQQAQSVLEPLIAPGGGDLREIGWAQLILGTCLGIRGQEGARGRTLLRSAAELLRASNDLAGAAIAKGNCGEVSWKGGDFVASEDELTDGLALARSLGMTINAIESQRNLIQVYLRWKGPWDSRIEPLEAELNKVTVDDIGKMEMMQVSNTLATLHLYRKRLGEAEKWLAIARPLTAGNDEYDIYTLANDGLLMALRSRGDAKAKIAAALDLCATGENLFALKQLRQDIVFCLGLAEPQLTSELLSMIDRQAKRIETCLL